MRRRTKKKNDNKSYDLREENNPNIYNIHGLLLLLSFCNILSIELQIIWLPSHTQQKEKFSDYVKSVKMKIVRRMNENGKKTTFSKSKWSNRIHSYRLLKTIFLSLFFGFIFLFLLCLFNRKTFLYFAYIFCSSLINQLKQPKRCQRHIQPKQKKFNEIILKRKCTRKREKRRKEKRKFNAEIVIISVWFISRKEGK